jgi:HAD superfamily hydrolase (TIGR01662 family)
MVQYVILFDLDNTLIEIKNSHQFFDQIIIDVFDEVGIKAPNLEQRNLLWRNSDYKTLLRNWNFPDGDHILFWKIFDKIDFKRRQELYSESKLIMYDDVVDILKRLQEMKVHINIITNTTEEITEFELRVFKISKYFDFICTLGDKQDICKPSPEGINIILKSLPNREKISLKNVYIVGDASVDIEAGKNAGIKTILINRYHKDISKFKEKPDYIIKNLYELIDILKLSNIQS